MLELKDKNARYGRAFAATLVTTAMVGVPLVAANAEEPVTINAGHVDAFYVTAEDDKLNLQLKEDVTGVGVIREAEDVRLVVKAEAFTNDLPDFWPTPQETYLLPIVQDRNLLWPGWSTQALEGTGLGPVDILIQEVKGPGSVHVFTMDAMTMKPKSVFRENKFQAPGMIAVDYPAHVHAFWSFSEPGTYTMTVGARAKKGDSDYLLSDFETYTWVVEDAAAPAPAPTPTATPTAEPTPTATPTAEPTPTETPTAEPTPTETPTAEPTPTETPTAEPTQPVEPGVTPTATATATPTAEPTQSVEPGVTPTATATATPTAEPTQSVEPGVTPTATATSVPAATGGTRTSTPTSNKMPSGALAKTGSSVVVLTVIGAISAAAGIALLVGARYRRRNQLG